MSDGFLTVPRATASAMLPLSQGGQAIWRQIEEALLAEIAGGVYPPEMQFPTEKELARRFEVNRHTVRRALAGLAQRGVLRVEQGRGSFVVLDAIPYALGPRTRFSENLLKQGREPQTELLAAMEEDADESVARGLKLRPGRKVIRLDTLGRADGRPISLGRHYLPAHRVPGMIERFTRLRSITRALREIGIEDYRRLSTRITARLPSAEEAHLLRLAMTQPLLATEGVNIETSGRPIEYTRGLFASDRVQLTVEL
jgi:GntR family phosphonate transport system transcriptional regulator